MLEINVSTKVGNKWESLPVPAELSKRIEMMKELAGSETVIKITTSNTMHFLCGTEDLRNKQAKALASKIPPSAAVCMTMAEAHMLLETNPEAYCVSIQLYSDRKD